MLSFGPSVGLSLSTLLLLFYDAAFQEAYTTILTLSTNIFSNDSDSVRFLCAWALLFFSTFAMKIMLNRMIYSQLIHQMVGGIMRVYLFHGTFYALLIWKTRPNTKSTLQCNLMKVKWLIHRHSTVFRQIAPCPVNCGHLCITLKPFSNFSTAFASRQQMNFEREKNASSSHFPSSSSMLINKLLFWTLEWKKRVCTVSQKHLR